MTTGAAVGWGVDLHSGEGGRMHESLRPEEHFLRKAAGLGDCPDLKGIVTAELSGSTGDGDIVVLTRTMTRAPDDGCAAVTLKVLEQPCESEIRAVNAALDLLGYTGPRHVRLLLWTTPRPL